MTNCKICGAASAAFTRSQDSDILRCPSCGLMFREPYGGCEASRCAGCADRCIDHLDDPAFLAARLRVDGRRAERIKELAGGDLSKMSVLELGAGLGCLASALSKSAARYSGTEASPVFRALIAKNFPALAGSVSDGPLPGPEAEGSFDLLVMVDVLQFAPEPAEFARRALAALKPGGLVYIEVPDESLLRVRARVRRALGLYRGAPLHHGHINFFTPRSLRALLDKAGLEPVTLRQASIAADEDRLFLTLKRPLPAWVRALSLTARLTSADTLAGLGNTVCLCRKR